MGSQFHDQLQSLIKTLNDSTPRYVRCIKPNTKASPLGEDFDANSVGEQLRASSILEAVRIRKIGYGYRLPQVDFADKFWPIVGQRILEPERQLFEHIFEKAASLVEGKTVDHLLPGNSQQWQIGVTKIFMKDEARYGLEAALHKVMQQKALYIQCKARQKLARNKF